MGNCALSAQPAKKGKKGLKQTGRRLSDGSGPDDVGGSYPGRCGAVLVSYGHLMDARRKASATATCDDDGVLAPLTTEAPLGGLATVVHDCTMDVSDGAPHTSNETKRHKQEELESDALTPPPNNLLADAAHPASPLSHPMVELENFSFQKAPNGQPALSSMNSDGDGHRCASAHSTDDATTAATTRSSPTGIAPMASSTPDGNFSSASSLLLLRPASAHASSSNPVVGRPPPPPALNHSQPSIQSTIQPNHSGSWSGTRRSGSRSTATVRMLPSVSDHPMHSPLHRRTSGGVSSHRSSFEVLPSATSTQEASVDIVELLRRRKARLRTAARNPLSTVQMSPSLPLHRPAESHGDVITRQQVVEEELPEVTFDIQV